MPTNYSNISEEQKSLLESCTSVANLLWNRGWAERNAGNFTINVTDLFDRNTIFFDHYHTLELEAAFPLLANQVFLTTISGGRMRTLANDALDNLLLVKISEEGNSITYGKIRGSNTTHKPTSELYTHLAMHSKIKENEGTQKVVLHAHVTEVISFTHFPDNQSRESFNKTIWSMHPETAMFIPKGVGYIPYSKPGTYDIASLTVEIAGEFDLIIWEKHGTFSIHNDLDSAFDNMDLVAKACKIWLTCKSAGIEPEGLSDEDIELIKGTA